MERSHSCSSHSASSWLSSWTKKFSLYPVIVIFVFLLLPTTHPFQLENHHLLDKDNDKVLSTRIQPFPGHHERRHDGHERERRSYHHRITAAGRVHPPEFFTERLQISSALRVMGPYFESNRTSKYVKVRAGHDVLLDCAVVLLQGRTVSWLRRKGGSVQLLTVGNQTYSSESSRLGLHFRYPNNWRLGILKVEQQDEGEYQCQLSTHPPKALVFHLRVIAPAVQILDDNEHVITERHYKVDSSLHLSCRASNLDKGVVDQLTWFKGDQLLPGNDTRIKVKHFKNQTSGEASALLSLHSVRKEDSGNYSCLASEIDKMTILVHVLNEKHPEAVQYENCVSCPTLQLILLFLCLYLFGFFSCFVPM